MFKDLFKLRGKLTSTQKIVLGILGFVFFIIVWTILAEALSIQNIREISYEGEVLAEDMKYYENDSLQGEDLDYLMALSNDELETFGLRKDVAYSKLPRPLDVATSYGFLSSEMNLFPNLGFSLFLNFVSYLIAIIISLIIGSLMGLIPFFRGIFGQLFDAFRFIPLAAITFVFVLLFDIGYTMKISFLAFGIIVYLVPVTVQRIDEVRDVYLKTVFTLGATNWDTIRTVYIPSVISRLSDDIRVLTAISWTYITIAEMVNNTGGLGGMIFLLRRQSNIEGAYAIIIIIILIGIIQDYLLRLLDRWLFPFKYIERSRS